MFDTIGIVGVGLIGGSIALEFKDKKICKTVFGFDKDDENINKALELNIIDKKANLEDIGVCDFIVVSIPVISIEHILNDIFKHAKKDAIIIDVGSTKANIIESAVKDLPKDIHFIPTHPIAGNENFGPTAARLGLFNNAYFIITPIEEVSEQVLKVKNIFEMFGCKVELMDYKKHDYVFSYISHLPHILAYNLVGLIKKKYDGDTDFRFMGGGFKDFVRIAKSNEYMWRDIFIDNKKNILNSLDEFINEINEIKQLIDKSNENAILEYLKKTRKFKENLDELYFND